MNSILISPKHHIKDLHKLQQFQCTICFEVQPTLMRCRGPCKANVCLACASSMCLTTDQAKCPHRCSPLLILQPIPNLQFKYHCPYDHQKCKADISGREAFMDHLICCEYITTEALNNNLRSDQHLCDKDHSLLFLDKQLINYFLQINYFMQESTIANLTFKCSACGENKICRSYCQQCSKRGEKVAYCHQCRKLPCTKEICPNGTHFLQRKQSSYRDFCDLCSNSIYLICGQFYQDQHCNIGICMPCYQKLPEVHPLVPLQSNIQHKIKNKVQPALNFPQPIIPAHHLFPLPPQIYPHHHANHHHHQEHSQENSPQDQSQNDSLNFHVGGDSQVQLDSQLQPEQNDSYAQEQQQQHQQLQLYGEQDEHHFGQEEEVNMFAQEEDENQDYEYQNEANFEDFYDD